MKKKLWLMCVIKISVVFGVMNWKIGKGEKVNIVYVYWKIYIIKIIKVLKNLW